MKRLLQLVFILIFNFLSAQEATYEILNTSINSKFAELGVTYSSNNSVIFASSKKDDSRRRTNNRQLGLELYLGLIAENGDIIQTEKFTTEINNKFFESDISFTPDFKTVFFTWNNFYNTQTRKDSAKWKTLRIFKGSINEKFEISELNSLPFNNNEYSVRSPMVSKDGKKLFFVSDMPGGYGETDIYVVDIYNDGNYGIPKNLGPTINTKLSELFPYVDENNALYFSSYGHKGKGGLDIFKSEFKNSDYQQAISLPTPINSENDDFAFVIKIASNSGYFTSNRDGGKGGVDIYAFKIKEPECTQSISVLALNQLTERPLDQVAVSLFQNNRLIEKHTISKNSSYKFNIECDKTYRLVAEKENFETAELTLTTDGKHDLETSKTLKLTPKECVQLLSGTILDSKTNLPMDQVTVSLFQDNTLIEKQSIAKNSNYKFNIECDKTYRLVAEKENYETAELTLTTDGKHDFETSKTLKLTPKECVQLLSGTILDSKTNLPIEQANVSLFQNNRLVEKQTISKNSNYKFNIECDKTYKIVAEKENFETAELTLTTDGKHDLETSKTLKLTPKECVQLLSGTILDSKTNLPMDQVTVSLFQDNTLIEKQSISKNSNYKFNIECDKTYRLVAEKENYEAAELTLTTDGKHDFETSKTLKLTPKECVQLLSGTILDSKTNLPIEQANVSLFQNNRLIEKQTIAKNSNYKFNIECDKTYKIVAEKENYETAELALTTDGKYNFETTKTLKLTPKECVQLLSGTILDSKTNLPIEQANVSLFQNNNLIEKHTISKNSSYKFNIECDKTYKIVAEKENFETAELTLTTDGKYNFETTKTLKLTPKECVQLLSGTVVDSKTNLSMNQVTVSLFQNNRLVEKQTISKNSSYKFNIECDKTYKIIAEKENYETTEFTFTTDGKYNVETSKILKLTPIECVQLLSGTVVDSKTNLSMNRVTVSLFQNNRLVEKQTISKNSSYKFNIECDKTYEIVAEKENYETLEYALTTDGKYNFETTKTLKLTPKECVQLLSGTVVDSKTNLQTDQVTVSLFQNNRLIEKQTISKNSNYKFNIECDKTYKIVTEKENYETSEFSLATDGKYNSETTKTLKLTPKECVQLLSGTVVDSKTNLPMDQVTISLFQNNTIIEKQTVSKNSGYKLNIECDKTYRLVAEKENFETAELILTTNSKYNFETSKILNLTPIECVQLLSGTVVDEETNLPLPNAVVTIYNRNELLERINLDANGVFNYKLGCGSQYRFKVSLKNYHDAISIVNTSDKRDEALNIVLAMESSIEFVSDEVHKMIKTKTINFDLNQSSIRLDAAIELNKVIAILRKYPKLKIEIKSHTDSRAPADYSMKLTNDRAKKVIDYIVENGIDKSRVSGRGYGETQLLNNCAKGVICTESEHQMNRRTEFIITDE